MNTRRHASWLLSLLMGTIAIALVAGCQTTSVAGEDRSQVVVNYRRSGGIAGLNDQLTISGDRKATIAHNTAKKTIELDQSAFNRIVQQLEQAEFSKLDKEYLPANRCCDLFEYTITYKGRTVRTMDSAVPDKLQPVLKSLSEVLDNR